MNLYALKILLDMHFRYDIQRTRLVSVVET